VVGGGVIGLSAAWRLAQRGDAVTLYDPAPGSGASHVAAGMLAPVTEVHYGEEAVLELNLESARRYPRFVAELERATELTTGYQPSGTIVVARDGDDLAALDRLSSFQRDLGLEVTRLRAGVCRELEPGLAPGIRGGLLVAGDHQVNPRLLVAALLQGCRHAGVRFVAERVTEIPAGDVTVIAAGCWSGDIGGVDISVRPVKGQLLRLRGKAGIERTVRGLDCYIVPRPDGEVVVGATVEERGFDTTVTAGAIYELLRAAVELVPDVAELELAEASAGLRPATADNAPLIERRGDVVIATGHYRNGVLLAPLTADLVAELVA